MDNNYKLNGEAKFLFEQLKAELNNIIKMEEERWHLHDENAKAFRQEMREILSKKNGTSTWGPALGIGTFLLTIVIFVGSFLGTMVGNANQQSAERHTEQSQQIKDLDTMLQREMQLMHDTTNEKIKSLRELINLKSMDRFTGEQGKMLVKQIDTLEERMTFLTKEFILHEKEHKEQ